MEPFWTHDNLVFRNLLVLFGVIEINVPSSGGGGYCGHYTDILWMIDRLRRSNELSGHDVYQRLKELLDVFLRGMKKQPQPKQNFQSSTTIFLTDGVWHGNGSRMHILKSTGRLSKVIEILLDQPLTETPKTTEFKKFTGKEGMIDGSWRRGNGVTLADLGIVAKQRQTYLDSLASSQSGRSLPVHTKKTHENPCKWLLDQAVGRAWLKFEKTQEHDGVSIPKIKELELTSVEVDGLEWDRAGT